MQAIDLDFHKTGSGSRWLGVLLAATAIVFTGHLIYSYQRIQQTIAQQQQQLGKLQRPRDAFSRAETLSRSIAPEEIVFARETIERISTPWDELFTALESVTSDKISLLAIEPDSKAGTVMIAADARSYAAVLDYVSRLRHSKRLRSVNLVRHEVRQEDQQKPVAFSVSASWRQSQP